MKRSGISSGQRHRRPAHARARIRAASTVARSPAFSVQECTVHGLPDSITDDQGALLELLSVAVHAVRRSGLAAGDSASIVGAGPIGLVTLAVARAASASEIFIVERATAGKDKACTGDAHHVIDPADGDPVHQSQRSPRAASGSTWRVSAWATPSR